MIPELLAPAGSITSLHAAVDAGADAVYLGLEAFNARRNADNFTLETFEQAADYAHLRGVKLYVTMNTMILPHELDEAVSLAKAVYVRGADAAIVQDIGLASRIVCDVPDLSLHISTQMNTHSSYGIEAVAALGAKRATLARELSISEIAKLADVARFHDMEVEVFAHGALCVCYSGQCFMSSMIGGRSANRGLCAQACRLPYTLKNTNHPDQALRAPGEFLLSPKDLCSIDHISDLAEAGVSSLKIEGRMKSPEYVWTVVSVYREALDAYASSVDALNPGEETHNDAASSFAHMRLASVFSRGFSPAYLEGIRDNEMMSYQRPNNRGQFAGRVKNIDDNFIHIATEITISPSDIIEFWTRKGNTTYRVPKVFESTKKGIHLPIDALEDEKKASELKNNVHVGDRVFRVRSADAAFEDDPFSPRIPVNMNVRMRLGEPLQITATTLMGVPNVATAEGELVEAARTKAVTVQDVKAHVDRLGQTPFVLNNCEVDLDEGVGIGFSQIHKLRAQALELLEAEILAPYTERKDAFANADAHHRENRKHSTKRVDWRIQDKQLEDFSICVRATHPDVARAAKRAGADHIYVPALNYKRGQSEIAGSLIDDETQAGFPKKSILIMPAIDHDFDVSGGLINRESEIGLDLWEMVDADKTIVAESLAAIQHGLDLSAAFQVGSRLPVTNEASLQVVSALGANVVWLSPELNLEQIASLAKCAHDLNITLGLKVQGADELMVTEHCALMSQGDCAQNCRDCSRRKQAYVLEDRKGYEFPVVSDIFGRSHIYNSVPLDIVSALGDLISSGVEAFQIDATLMNAEQAAQATGRLRKALSQALAGDGSVAKLPNTTSGHIFRGVS